MFLFIGSRTDLALTAITAAASRGRRVVDGQGDVTEFSQGSYLSQLTF